MYVSFLKDLLFKGQHCSLVGALYITYVLNYYEIFLSKVAENYKC